MDVGSRRNDNCVMMELGLVERYYIYMIAPHRLVLPTAWGGESAGTAYAAARPAFLVKAQSNKTSY